MVAVTWLNLFETHIFCLPLLLLLLFFADYLLNCVQLKGGANKTNFNVYKIFKLT